MKNKTPEFWDEIISTIPVCIELEKNWIKIRDEYLVQDSHNNNNTTDSITRFSVPKFAISNGGQIDKESSREATTLDSAREGNEKLHDGVWEGFAAGTMPKEDINVQWANTNYIRKVLKWKTKRTIPEHLEDSRKKFPTFNKIVNEFADEGQCSGAFYSLVKPGTTINPHFGADEHMRCHLSLINDPKCILTVGDKSRTWEEGKILAFKDGRPYMHSVRHNGDKDRLVLFFDFDMTYLRARFPDIEGL